ncbi:hypothetical protein CH063_14892 [Colletotrichum higginsianum]|uniref:Uncharacterized protein n=1 Tax=Colletotrichum higginsianum (strain IMI 349063) TaxID=759273 RepID=H1W0I7_COLHI|nr:hypothetical protein CH063_14892 [Colletotrichum higginsianum]
MLGFLSSLGALLGSPDVPRTLWAKRLTAGELYLEGILPGVARDGLGPGVICSFRTGDSGRTEGLLIDFFSAGLEARPGPTDLLNIGTDGVGGV